MKSSLITKMKIAKAFRQLMEKESFSKIAVSDIMEKCNIRRQTFYKYFKDKYDLLEWIFHQEANENIEDNLEYESWENIVSQIFIYLEDNQRFYRHALEFSGQNSFKEILYDHVYLLMKTILNQLGAVSVSQLSADYILKYSIDFFSQGLVEVIVGWLKGGCKETSEKMAKKIFNY